MLLFVLMAFHFVGLQWHEITGAVMMVLFILHHILNGNWYRALEKGKYRPSRILLTVVDVVLLVDMLLLMFSGIAMSRYVFRFLDIPVSKAWARRMHMTASCVGFLLMGFHIGLHYGMIMGMVKKAFSALGGNRDRKRKAVCTWILRAIAVLIAAYGAYAMVTIMGLMIFISYYLQKFLQRRILFVSNENQRNKE